MWFLSGSRLWYGSGYSEYPKRTSCLTVLASFESNSHGKILNEGLRSARPDCVRGVGFSGLGLGVSDVKP